MALFILLTLADGAAASVEAEGRYIDCATGVQASGLTADAAGNLWTVGDRDTKLPNMNKYSRLFQIKDPAKPRLYPTFEIGKGKIREYDFEGVCRLGPNELLVVTERNPEELRILRIANDGTLKSSQAVTTGISEKHPNKRLEGVACSPPTIFLAYEGSRVHNEPTTILFFPAKKLQSGKDLRKSDLESRELQVPGALRGLHYLPDYQGKEYLLAIVEKNQENEILIIPIEDSDLGEPRAVKVRLIDADTRSPIKKKLEGITVVGGKIWLINDPKKLAEAGEKGGCTDSARGELPDNYKDYTPLLFSTPLADVLEYSAARPKPEASTSTRSATAGRTSRATATQNGAIDSNRYDDLRSKLNTAGRQRKLNRIDDLIEDIEEEIGQAGSREASACWYLLKGTALFDLGRRQEARATFDLLADTCPTWHALNNLAVLQAAGGEFKAAESNLCDARRLAGAQDSRPEGNLISLRTEQDLPSLQLVGNSRECASTGRVTCTGLPPRQGCQTIRPAPSGPRPAPAPPPPPPSPPVQAPPSSTPPPPSGQQKEAPPANGNGEPTAVSPALEAEINNALLSWKLAWEAAAGKEPGSEPSNQYLSSYAQEVRDQPPEFLKRRLRFNARKEFIQITLDGIKQPESAGDEEVLVQFHQTYRSNDYCDKGPKTLLLRNEAGEWKIVEETQSNPKRFPC